MDLIQLQNWVKDASFIVSLLRRKRIGRKHVLFIKAILRMRLRIKYFYR